MSYRNLTTIHVDTQLESRKVKMKDYQISVFIGRFQPFHNSHLEVVKHGLSIADKLLIVIGSSNSAPTIKNPFSFQERKDMISSCFNESELSRIAFIPVRDHFYNDTLWCAEVQQKTSEFITPGDNVALLGNYKDSSSFYLDMFPQWEFEPYVQKNFMNATDIRDIIFNGGSEDRIEDKIPLSVLSYIINEFPNKKLGILCEEYKFIQNYKNQWKDSPYEPIFTTVDAVVTCNAHVLVVKRGLNPGKGLYALPGGFLKSTERLKDAAVRELKEETGIDVHKGILKANVASSHVFDYPGRSLRGRTITNAFHIPLDFKELPRLKSGTDAESVKWMCIADVYKNEDKFYEDHFHIIQHFITRQQ